MLAAGVSFADVLMCQGIHPEARRPPFTPGWEVVEAVDVLGEGVEAVPLGATVAAMPIVGVYVEYLCLPATELVRLPPKLDSAEATPPSFSTLPYRCASAVVSGCSATCRINFSSN